MNCILKHCIRRGRESCHVHGLGPRLLYTFNPTALLGGSIWSFWATDRQTPKIATAAQVIGHK